MLPSTPVGSRLGRGVGVALVACLSACNCGTAVRPLSPQILVTPLQISFTNQSLNTTAQWPVQVKNVGQGVLNITGITPAQVNDITVPEASLLATDCSDNPRTGANLMQIASSDCAVFQVAFTPSAVESITNTITVASNDPEHPKVEVQVTASGVLAPFPQIQVCVLDASGMQSSASCTNFTPTPPQIPTLDFGTVQYGQDTTRTLRVLSTGTSNLVVSNIRLDSTSPDLALMGLPMFPDTLAPNANSDVQVALTPSASGTVTGTAVFLSNDANHPEIDIPITAEEVAPCLQVTPSSLTFGPLVVGTTQMQSVQVTNCGSSAYQITTMDFVPTNPSSTVYTLSSGDASGMLPIVPFTFNPGDTHTLDLTYAPTAATTPPGDTGQITVVTSYGDTQNVPVTGTAIAQPQIEVCVLDVSGNVNPADCSNLSATPPFIPSVVFGTLQYGQTASQTVRILNVGGAPLVVSSLTLTTSTPDLTLPTPPATPFTLMSGGTTDVKVSFASTGSGAVTGTLAIASNDPNNPNVPVPITADEVGPCLLVAPAAIDLGTVTVGTSAKGAMSITNCGMSSYQITSWNFAPTVAGSTVFTITVGDPSGALPAIPFTFNPGDVHTLDVTYTPIAVGTDTGAFTVTTSYGATQTVPVVGMSAAKPVPEIEVCVLGPGGAVIQADCTNFATTPPFIPSVAFGTLQYEQQATQTVEILNIGQATLTVSGLNLTSSTSDLTIASAPSLSPALMLAPGASANVVLALNATGSGAVNGDLTVLSNDPSNPDIPVPITATEVPPCLQVTPTAINFGTVTVGSSAMQSTSITNCGQSTYSITQWSFAGASDFSVTPGDPSGTLPAIPFSFAPGATHTLDLTYKPTAASTGSGDTGAFTVTTSYGATQTVPVVAQAIEPCGGTEAPVAGIAVTQNGTAVTGSVLPLTTVTLSGAPSTAATGRNITSYQWTLLSSPPTSTTMLSATSGETTTLYCSIVGTYQVELLVTDSDGCTSAQAIANIQVKPGSGLHVQLTWAQPYGDLDLHYLGPKGTFFDLPRGRPDYGGGSDNFYLYAVHEFNGPGNPGAKIYPYGFTPVDWGYDDTTQPDGITTDDPSLDADQLWGYGPENVTQAQPFTATYTVMVHYYCSSAYDEYGNTENFQPVANLIFPDPDCGDQGYGDGHACYSYGNTTPTVSIYWNGSLIVPAMTLTQQLVPKHVWTAATIQVNGTNTPTVTAVGDVAESDYGCTDGNWPQ